MKAVRVQKSDIKYATILPALIVAVLVVAGIFLPGLQAGLAFPVLSKYETGTILSEEYPAVYNYITEEKIRNFKNVLFSEVSFSLENLDHCFDENTIGQGEFYSYLRRENAPAEIVSSAVSLRNEVCADIRQRFSENDTALSEISPMDPDIKQEIEARIDANLARYADIQAFYNVTKKEEFINALRDDNEQQFDKLVEAESIPPAVRKKMEEFRARFTIARADARALTARIALVIYINLALLFGIHVIFSVLLRYISGLREMVSRGDITRLAFIIIILADIVITAGFILEPGWVFLLYLIVVVLGIALVSVFRRINSIKNGFGRFVALSLFILLLAFMVFFPVLNAVLSYDQYLMIYCVPLLTGLCFGLVEYKLVTTLFEKNRFLIERSLEGSFFIFASVSIISVIFITAFIVSSGLPIFRVESFAQFMLGPVWDPVYSPETIEDPGYNREMQRKLDDEDFRYGINMVVNSKTVLNSNGTTLTTVFVWDLASIYAKQKTNWSDLDDIGVVGPDAPVKVFNRTEGSVDYNIFRERVMERKGHTFAEDRVTLNSIDEVLEKVNETPYSVAYIGYKRFGPEEKAVRQKIDSYENVTIMDVEDPRFGILAFVVGSIWVTLLALVIAVPVGIAVGIFMAEMAKARSARVIRSGVELLAGIPSVIYGLFGFYFIVPIVRDLSPSNSGLCILSAAIVLGIMVLPTIINITEVSIRAVPRELKEGSLALGATHWQTIIKTILPSAGSGIIAGIALGIGRAVGETMAVLMVAGNAKGMPTSIFSQARTLTMNMVTDLKYAEVGSYHEKSLFATGIVLFLFILVINLTVQSVLKKSLREKD